MKRVLIIDNFDSFTFNLYQYFGELADTVAVARNDAIPFERIRAGDFTHLVISPGPGNPTDLAYFGQCYQLIDEFYTSYPLLGICLGHQGIAAYFGATVSQAPSIMHGKTSDIEHRGTGLLANLPSPLTVMRYHSLATTDIPDTLVVDAVAEDGTIMAFHHTEYPVFGIQFHPESFATPAGKQMLLTFLG